jgi:hypothetical protein
MHPIQWTKQPTGALVAAGSFYPGTRTQSYILKLHVYLSVCPGSFQALLGPFFFVFFLFLCFFCFLMGFVFCVS